ncbi:DUF6377 domain-containing protein [Chitinophaga rhizophila]|uniref:DUF6377 domain-containing protein n=1 Tax=Chitinophaga rhizophila TaxID=2866212 RepID=A0ABS7G9T6_9BACT|nr:DUF6377 domain-containing protein [Chitinophaga rhizophila]MBW8683293.1 hypothetical protein [Chitinophaga rhizophila]
MEKVLFVSVFLLLLLSMGHAQTKRSDSLIIVLKSELAKDGQYDKSKEKRIEQLKMHLVGIGAEDFKSRFNLYTDIFREYSSYKFDSAFQYVRLMTDLSEQFGKKQELIQSQILMGTTLVSSGFYKEAFDITDAISSDELPNTLKTDFLFLRARLNAGIADYDNDAYFSREYYRQSAEDFKSAEIATPSNDFEQTINLAFNKDSVAARHLTPDFFYHTIIRQSLPAHNVAMVATRVSYAYTGYDRVLFLTLAAINDVRSSTKETLAIFLLGQELFKLGKTNDAYEFMQEAAKNAKFYGARNQVVQIESMLPLVAGKIIDEKQHEKDKLLIGLLIFLIVAVVLFFLLVIYRRQLQRIKVNEQMIREKNTELEDVNAKLWESSRIKEELIGLFFKTCSSYIDTLDKIKHKTLHSIKLGKYKEVSQLLKEVQVEEEKDRLYEMLDSVFLTMFPNFIASFNALLKKEDQIWPKSGETLNATLRIFALIRLGITEHEAIAKILDYSVSTVYTYKTRIKSRALVPANDFEQRIMEIKFIDSNYF